MPSRPHPIAQVNPGMRVVDRAGEEVGEVVTVRTGDPNAVTAQEPPTGHGVLSGKVPHPDGHHHRRDGDDEPDVPADLAARLLRVGYLTVDARGLFARDVYVSADEIARVRDDVVELAVDGDALARAGG
jgi:hypothetical protein